MCGITGFISPSLNQENLKYICSAMTKTLHHRGPNDGGIWVDQQTGVGLGHRRLSILDLSPLGHQPMQSPSNRFVLVYNGEVYNHLTMRQELNCCGHSFRGNSDTETLLAAFNEWGISATLKRCIGMFALALWDKETRILTLARDRVGIKPLYYGMAGKSFVFGSELKALKAHPDFDSGIDRNALSLYFRHNYIPTPYSIYKSAKKLKPGTFLQIYPDGTKKHTTYWSAAEVWQHGHDNQFQGSFSEAADHLENLLKDSISKRQLSDVPVGAFLSGGIDSSTVVALMQAGSSRKIKTFSIGFDESNYNEAIHARTIADYLGTDHTELYLSPKDLLSTIPDIPYYWDEPFADSSQIPTVSVCRMARKHVTVALSGDGGDELFSGYTRYFWTNRYWKTLQRLPWKMRKTLVILGRFIPAPLFKLLGPMGPKIEWRLDALAAKNYLELYKYFLSHHKRSDSFVIGANEPKTIFDLTKPCKNRFHQMAGIDIQTYLPDDILTKVDRASMLTSLEARVPLLDHRLVEFAAQIPTSFKINNDKGKLLLREVLHRYIPPHLVERPKMGFGIPIGAWLKNELRDWCEDLLDASVLKNQNYIKADVVRSMWDDHIAGRGNWSYYLWDVLMFQAWIKKWRDER